MKVFRAGLKPRYIDEAAPQEKAKIRPPQGILQGSLLAQAAARQKPGLQFGHKLPGSSDAAPVKGIPAVNPRTPTAVGKGSQIITAVVPKAIIDNNVGKKA